MLGALSYSYNIGSSANVFTLSPTAVTATPAPLTPCSSIVFELIYDPSGTPDPTVFLFDSIPNTFTTYTIDNGKEGTYNFLLNTRYDGYSNPQTASANRSFQIQLVDTCALAVLEVDRRAVSSLSYSYDIGATPNSYKIATGDVTATPPPSTHCGDIVFEITD